MHVLIDAHLAVKEIDGITRYLNGLLGALPALDAGVRYTVLTLPEAESGLPAEIFANANVRRVEVPLRGPTPRQHLVTRRWIRQIQPDVYHHPHFDLPLGVGVPAVATVHDLKYLCHPEFFPSRGRLKSGYMKACLRHTLHAAAQVIAVSENTRRDLQRMFHVEPDRVAVVPHGVELSPVADGPQEAAPRSLPETYVLFVGTRRPHKNLTGLIRALQLLRTRHGVAADLVVAGKPYAGYAEPEALAHQLGLDAHVHFLDFVEDAQLATLYRQARVVALPSFYEGFGFPLVEAMSCGTPVVGSSVTSIPEVVGDAGLLADPHDPADLAAKLARILKDTKLAAQLARAGKQRAQRFTWNSVAKSTLNVYNRALQRGNR